MATLLCLSANPAAADDGDTTTTTTTTTTTPANGTNTGNTTSNVDCTTTFIDPATGLRAVCNTPTANSSDGSPGSASNVITRPGCSSLVQGAMNTTAAYSAVQTVSAHVNTVQQPSSFSSCLKNILGSGKQNNAFLSSGLSGSFSFSGVLDTFMDSAVNSLVANLESQACAEVKQAANGVMGSISIPNYKAGPNGPMITMQPGTPSLTSVLP